LKQNEIQVMSVKRGKTCCKQVTIGLALRLIGWESGASFFDQSENALKQNQSKDNVICDTQ